MRLMIPKGQFSSLSCVGRACRLLRNLLLTESLFACGWTG